MASYNFTQPLCLSCRIALEHKLEFDETSGIIYEIDRCPNCGEVFNKMVTGNW